jgi:hypothetical protein
MLIISILLKKFLVLKFKELKISSRIKKKRKHIKNSVEYRKLNE